MKTIAVIAAAALAATAVPASAANLYSNPVLLGDSATPGSVSFNANAAGGSGTLSFNLDGFRTLDGVNCCQDNFSLSLNGTEILSLSYDLGGGGSNTVFTDLYNAAITGGTFGFGQGGQLQIAIASLPLLAGSNTFTFAYSGSAQGLGDEGWGVSSVSLTGAGVPEPATWALMILGMGAIGGAMRRRQAKPAVRFA